jgi:phosphoribosylanthranilate isomerase
MTTSEPLDRSVAAGRSDTAAVRVKICGITSVADAGAAVAAGADMVGLNFYPRSRRVIDVARAVEIVAALPEHVWRVGIFVNAERAQIEQIVDAVGLSAIQLSGDESSDLVEHWNVKVIRSLRLRSADDARRALDSCEPDYFLCEGHAAGAYGGAGVGFDWMWARDIPPERLFLAGGLTPDNVADAVRVVRPFAVDVATGVERSPGVKDPARMAALVAHAKSA